MKDNKKWGRRATQNGKQEISSLMRTLFKENTVWLGEEEVAAVKKRKKKPPEAAGWFFVV